MVYRGHVQNGVVVVDGAPELPEGAEVRVELLTAEGQGSTLGQRLMEFAGVLKGLPADLARNHDHYLSGVPSAKG
jgi:hypothetical protein